jgi:glutathione-specific gamma-glutamylcyclotransferase
VNEDLWLFGYGSIMWKTGFSFDEARLGFIRGRARRFWQGSTDHRGTESAPGRVVTLIDAPGEICWGVAYRIPVGVVAPTIEALDYREKGGYTREDITIEFKTGGTTTGVTYHANTANPNFLGQAPIEHIARQIACSHGPSGSNKEYILQLHHTLKQHEIVDEHVRELADLVDCFSNRLEREE